MKPQVPWPPGPKGSFFFGHVADFRRDPLGLFTRCAREYGDFVPLRFGPQLVIHVADPDAIESVLVTHRRQFIKSVAVRALRPVAGNGLFLSEGEFWLRQRRLLQPAFHRERMGAYGETMVHAAERLLATWPPGEVRDVHQEMTRLTMEIVAKTLFDADVQTEAAEVGAAITEALAALNTRLGSLWLLVPDRVPTPSSRRLRRAVRRLDALVYRMIAERRAEQDAGAPDRGDLLSLLLAARDADDGSQMTDLQVRDEAMTLFLAGHETTATTLAWAWYLLAQHPEVEAKVVAEVQAVLGGTAPTAAHLPQLRYTESVVTETFRLYPPVIALGREAVEDCVVGDFLVKKGTALIMSPWVMQRDPRYFAEPDRFWPERWSDGLAQRLPRFAYFPFGGGPRLCIGQGFAMMEATLVLATVLQQTRLRLVPGQAITPVVAPTLRPVPGPRMVREERTA
jgi:cytochrome P450